MICCCIRLKVNWEEFVHAAEQILVSRLICVQHQRHLRSRDLCELPATCILDRWLDDKRYSEIEERELDAPDRGSYDEIFWLPRAVEHDETNLRCCCRLFHCLFFAMLMTLGDRGHRLSRNFSDTLDSERKPGNRSIKWFTKINWKLIMNWWLIQN